MPDWAVERSVELGAEAAETIRSLGVRVIGDLSTLTEVPVERRGNEADLGSPTAIPADAASLAGLPPVPAEGAAGALLATARAGGGKVSILPMPARYSRHSASAGHCGCCKPIFETSQG